MYDEAMNGIKTRLVYRSKANEMIYTAELQVRRDREGGQSVLTLRFSALKRPFLTLHFYSWLVGHGSSIQSRTTSSASSVAPSSSASLRLASLSRPTRTTSPSPTSTTGRSERDSSRLAWTPTTPPRESESTSRVAVLPATFRG